MVLPSYRRGRRSFRVSLSGAVAVEDIIGGGGDGGRRGGGGGCGGPPLVGLRGERVRERPRGGDGGEGAGGSPEEGSRTSGTADAGASTVSEAQALAQGLEGDLLVLDLDWRPVGEDGSWEGQGKNAARRIGMRGCFEDRADVAPFGSLYSADSPGEDESGRTVSDVDVDEVLGVESVNKALTRSHDGREEGE
ncbi:predicted protein, partial [Postia placenta Mad-698-R]